LANEGVRLVDLFDIVRLQASLISKAAYDALEGHDESLRICMDLDWAFRLFMTYPLAYLDRVVFLYRFHEGNIGRNEEPRLTENIRVMRKLLDQFPAAQRELGSVGSQSVCLTGTTDWPKNIGIEAVETRPAGAIRESTSLRPLSLKYRFYQFHWGAMVRFSEPA